MSADTPHASSHDKAFVGREHELLQLRAALADAVAGRGRLVLIAGEAGVGKTRLAAQLEGESAGTGARVCWARSWEGGGAPAFWPWTVLLRALARDCDAAVLAEALRGAGAAAAQLAPEFRHLVPDLPAPPGLLMIDSEHARFPLFAAVADLLQRLAAERPLVLVLDDLHAVDHPSLVLLASVARELHGARVLLLATTRDVDAEHDPERSRLLAAVARAGQRLPLVGWSANEVARFIAATTATAPPAALVETLHRTTDGNPFFVDEMVRLLVAQGHGRLPDQLSLRIPVSIRAAIRERLRPLADRTLEVLGVAAVVGRDFDLAVLREVCGIEAGALLDVLGEAERAWVVARHGDAGGRYAFTHALVRDALYEDLAPARRAHLHGQVGEALEHLHAADPTPHLEPLAHHFALAAPAGDVDKAIDYDRRAARRAADLLAFEAAVRHYERALEVQALRAPVDEALRLDLQLDLGDMQAAAWNLDAARQTFRTAADGARRLLRPDALGRAALGFAGLGFGLPRGVVNPEIVALLEEALRLIGDRRDALWARLAVRLAVELHFSEAVDRFETLSEQAVETARGAGDDATLAYVLNARHFAVWGTADPYTRLALVDEAIELAERLGERDLNLQGRTWRLLDLAEVGNGEEFDRELDVFERLNTGSRMPKYLGVAAALHGFRALWLGRFEDAVAAAEAVVALGERIGDRGAFASVAVQTFFARRGQGRLAEFEATGRAIAELYPANPVPRCLLALLYADLQREADARREFERLAADDFAALKRRRMLHPLAHSLAEVCVYLGDRRRAAILYETLEPFAGRVMLLGPHVLFGPASHQLATLAATLDRWPSAARHFEMAIEEANRMQGPVWLAAIQYDWARCLLEQGDTQRASEIAGAALAQARSLAMPALAARAAALQERCGEAARADEARTSKQAVGDARGRAAAGRPSGGRVVPFPVKPAASVRSGAAAPERHGVFRREDDYWSVGLDGDVVRLRGTSGLYYLAQLLSQPGREVHVLDLAVVDRESEETHATPRRAESARLSVTRAIRSALRRISENQPALGQHLAASVRTGLTCVYAPDPWSAPLWSL